MTRENGYFEEQKPCSNSYIDFGNRDRGRKKGIRKVISLGFPFLDDVLLVEGLTTNLIIISQPCDQGLNVSYNKS